MVLLLAFMAWDGECGVHGKPDWKSNISVPIAYTFCTNKNYSGYPRNCEIARLLEPNNGYILEDSIIVKADVIVNSVENDYWALSNCTELRFEHDDHVVSFYKPYPYKSDGVLVIGERDVFINKGYLAKLSPVFNVMFYSDRFGDKEKYRIELELVDPDEFVELLSVIYPEKKPITALNVESLLKLGDRFQMTVLLQFCCKFLLQTKTVGFSKKLMWADAYTLKELLNACLKKHRTMAELKKLEAQEEYQQISEDTKKLLAGSVCKISQSSKS
uniref:BTB domain-containing protein n=1 Tax=Ditylenchus dipsaci TaxID=166011 RepID=A0A915D4B2_9BILA